MIGILARATVAALIWFGGLGTAAQAQLLISGITTRNDIKSPFSWIDTNLVPKEKTRGCLSAIAARPVNKAGIEYERFSLCYCFVNGALFILPANFWNLEGTQLCIIRVSGLGGMEDCWPDRCSFSRRKGSQIIAHSVSGKIRFSSVVGTFWDVLDGMKFYTPSSSEGWLSSRIDKGQLYIHRLPDTERAVVSPVNSNPSSIRFNGRISGFENTPDHPASRDEGKACGYGCQAIQSLRDTYLSFSESKLLDSGAKTYMFCVCVILPFSLCISCMFFKSREYRFGAIYYSVCAFCAYAIIVCAAYLAN